MSYISVSKARSQWADILNRVHYLGERIVLQKHEKDLVAVIPLDDLELLEAIENTIDKTVIKTAVAEAKRKGTKLRSKIKIK